MKTLVFLITSAMMSAHAANYYTCQVNEARVSGQETIFDLPVVANGFTLAADESYWLGDLHTNPPSIADVLIGINTKYAIHVSKGQDTNLTVTIFSTDAKQTTLDGSSSTFGEQPFLVDHNVGVSVGCQETVPPKP